MIDKLKSDIQRLFWLGIALYAIGTLLSLGLHFIIGERWVMVALLNSFIHLLLLPAFVGIIIAALARRWRLTTLFLPAVGVMLIWYATLFVPKTHSAPESTPRLTVMTYNILQGDIPHLADKAQMMIDSQSDIIAVQELDTDSAEFLATALEDVYPYQALHHFLHSAVGQGIFSRYPIVEEAFWRPYFGHQRVVIDFDGVDIFVYNLHGRPPLRGDGFSGREHEMTLFLERLNAEDEAVPLIIAGDFNMTDRSDDYGRITENYRDAWREVGLGFGWTFNGTFPIPLLRIDYLFHNDAVLALDAQVIQNSAGSDHNPVLVEFAIVGD